MYNTNQPVLMKTLTASGRHNPERRPKVLGSARTYDMWGLAWMFSHLQSPSPIMALAASKCSDTIAFIFEGGKNIILWLNSHGSIVML